MNVEEKMKIASDFNKRGYAYVHTEMKNGKRPETIICGDMQAMLWCITAQLDRIAHKSGNSFEDTIGCVYALKRHGYKKLTKGCADEPIESVEGEDYRETIKEEVEKEANRQNVVLKQENEKLTRAIEALRRENSEVDKKISNVKGWYESQIRVLEKDNKELQKENKALDHKVNEIIEYYSGRTHSD